MVLLLHSVEEYPVSCFDSEDICDYYQMVQYQSVSLCKIPICPVHQPLEVLDAIKILIELSKRFTLGIFIVLKCEGNESFVAQSIFPHSDYFCSGNGCLIGFSRFFGLSARRYISASTVNNPPGTADFLIFSLPCFLLLMKMMSSVAISPVTG